MENRLEDRNDRSEGRSHIDHLHYDGETIIEDGVSQRFTPSSDDDSEERDKMNDFFEQSRVINQGKFSSGGNLPQFGSQRQVQRQPQGVNDIRESIAQMHESRHHDVELESREHSNNPYNQNLN